jgi:hypothetical protein
MAMTRVLLEPIVMHLPAAGEGGVLQWGIGPLLRVAAIFVPKCSAVLGNLETHARTVQGSRGAGLNRVPIPRCAWRSAERQSERLL